MKGSLIIIAFFIAGLICGYSGVLSADIAQSDISFYALCALLLSVGFSVGNDPTVIQRFRALNPRLAWLPVMTILGTLAGSWVVSLVLPQRSAVLPQRSAFLPLQSAVLQFLHL